MTVPTRCDVSNKILALLDSLEDAMERLLTAEATLDQRKWNLREAEIEALLMGHVDGKNTEIRQAQLEKQTMDLRRAVDEATREVRRARAQVEYRKEALSAWRAIARLVGEGERRGMGGRPA